LIGLVLPRILFRSIYLTLRMSLMNLIIALGLIGATLTTISLLPQLIKVFRSRSTKDISAGMFTLFGAAVFVWLIYGVLIKDIPLIIANSFALVQAIIILLFKIKYK
jgi:MtN3 and saliva related transmembrane protein